MNPAEFHDVLERVHARLKAGKKKRITQGERTTIRSVVGAWFSEYQSAFIQVVGDNEQIPAMDEALQDVLRLTLKETPRRTVVRALGRAADRFGENLLIPLSRAYWSQAPARSPAGRDEGTAARLRQLDSDLADSYEQAVRDIEETDRLSYRGPAAELREVVSAVLHKLAPNQQVERLDWYREARKSGVRTEPTPTRAERIKFILRSRAKGSATTETAESFMTSVEERLANVVNSTYKRGSAATHGGAERDELVQLLPYINAVLSELLPPASSPG